jgi:uncharacterized membrane protein YhiD involved in acid resistance
MDIWHIDPLHITIRLFLALLLGGMIGFERERGHRSTNGTNRSYDRRN